MWNMDDGRIAIISHRVNLTLTIMGAFIYITPLFHLQRHESIKIDDVAFIQIIREEFFLRSTSVMAPFFVTIIPAADLLLDLLTHISAYIHAVSRLPQKESKTSVVVRLCDTERFLFISGVAIQSCVGFLPLNSAFVEPVFTATKSASAVLVLGPVLNFLQRCTITFNPLVVFFIYFFGIIGIILSTSSIDCSSSVCTALDQSGTVFQGLAAIIFAVLTTSCAVKYCYSRIRSPANRQVVIDWWARRLKKTSKENLVIGINPIDHDRELYNDYIPAIHMIFCLVIIIANAIVFRSSNQKKLVAFDIRNYIATTAEVCVLIVELRIRKNEIARGLTALLESKKSYVRYISHELRTPLNTVFLGLKLLSCEMKSSTCPKDAERYDTLCDVNLSCMVAVDILNDLLCYEKMESGILELHKENINVESFLNECIAMFAGQADECGVHMHVCTSPIDYTQASNHDDVNDSILSHGDIDVDIRDGSNNNDKINNKNISNNNNNNENLDQTTHGVKKSVALPILSNDYIYADKFKMDQVVRNLVSNALKFTPPGGSVFIQATFQTHTNKIQSKNTEKKSNWMSDTGYLSLSGSKSDPPSKSTSPSKVGLRTFDSLQSPNFSVIDRWDGMNIRDEMGCTYGTLLLTVKDTGAGITLKNQKRLFNEIVQFNPEKLQAGGGSGLGLWITAGIISLHGGTINVFSEGEGKGSSFTAEIPMVRWTENQKEFDHIPGFKSILEEFELIPEVELKSNSKRNLNIDDDSDEMKSKTRERERGREIAKSDSQVEVEVEVGRMLSRSAEIAASYSYTPKSSISSVSTSKSNMPTSYISNDLKSECSSRNNIPGTRRTSKCQYGVVPDFLPNQNPKCLNILVVDDSRLNRKMLLKCLRSDGHNCDEGSDGTEAVTIVRERMRVVELYNLEHVIVNSNQELELGHKTCPKPFDVILMDFVMPHMDGPTATEIIRASGYKGIIFGVTGNALPSDVSHFLQCGADKVLIKPLDINAFRNAVNEST